MKSLSPRSAFTLIELLVVVALVSIFVALLLPALATSERSYNPRCMSNQKQIALGYLMWVSDHEEKFPAQVSIATNGSMEFVSTGYASLQFRALSDYLKSPYIFVCRADKKRQLAENMQNLRDENVSYFASVDATNSGPSKTILTGDRNLQAGGQAVRPGLFALATNLDLSWTGEMHSKGGLLAFVDGHVEFVRTNKLNDTILSQPLATNRVCVP